MADQKISALTEDTTPTSGDFIVTVDGATNKKVTLANTRKGLGLATTDDVVFGTVTATSYTIGVVTATSTEWAFLATMDQDVATTSSPTFVDLTLTGDTVITSGLTTLRSSESVADDGTIVLSTGKSGFGTVQAGDNEEFVTFSFTAAGVVSLITWTDNVVASDLDTNLCIYDGGSGVVIKNRLGGAKTLRYIINYSA